MSEQRERYLKRRKARAQRTPKGPPGYTPVGSGADATPRIVRRKLKQGRPGRPAIPGVVLNARKPKKAKARS